MSKHIATSPDTWKHVAFSDQLDLRYKIIADYLNDKVEDKTVWDLNCGTARLLKYLDAEWKEYIANDTMREYIDVVRGYNAPNLSVSVSEDTECLREIIEAKKAIDILVDLGHGAGDHQDCPESPTQTATVYLCLRDLKPEVFIYENVDSYEQRFGVVTKMIATAEQQGYTLKRKVYIDYDATDPISVSKRRHLLFFERIWHTKNYYSIILKR